MKSPIKNERENQPSAPKDRRQIRQEMNGVPLEAAVKYIVRERDRLKEKLDTIVPYTKRLEAELAALRDEKVLERDKEIQALSKRLASAEEQIKRLLHENSKLIKDCRKSDWFKQIEVAHKRRQAEKNALRDTLRLAYAELAKYKENQKT